LGDIGACFKVLAVQVADDVRLREGEQGVIALKGDGVVFEVAAIRGFIQPVCLDHRAHGTVEDGDPVTKKSLEFGGRVVESCHALLGKLYQWSETELGLVEPVEQVSR